MRIPPARHRTTTADSSVAWCASSATRSTASSAIAGITRTTDQEHGWFERVKRRALRMVAESIAEQRLLWHMRRQHEAVLVHPEDLAGEAAMAIVRPALKADFEKHRRWLVIDGVLVLLSALLILVPGPNVLGYYFAFRVVGHYFSMRGARQALDHVVWTTRPTTPSPTCGPWCWSIATSGALASRPSRRDWS